MLSMIRARLRSEADTRFGATGWLSVSTIFTLPGRESESITILNSDPEEEAHAATVAAEDAAM